jgi:hypothetical protein
LHSIIWFVQQKGFPIFVAGRQAIRDLPYEVQAWLLGCLPVLFPPFIRVAQRAGELSPISHETLDALFLL